jgi:pimeloyl-ACP methyl ester carboxylesterase
MNKVIKLPNGRSLGYAQYGDQSGKPIIFFHGTPSSRLLRHPDDSLTESLRVHLVTIDRPGFGLSTYQPNRQLLDWPGDVATLADELGIERFAVAGISGGGPYVAACAYKIPHRLTVAGIISGVGPTDVDENIDEIYITRKAGVILARNAPWLLRPLIWLLQNPQRNPEKYYQKNLAQLSPADQEILRRPEIKSLLMKSWSEGTRRGIRGFTREGIIFSNPWGFQLEDIRVKVHIWHGNQDTSTPITMAQYIASRIPHGQLTIIPDKGHFLLFDHWEEILTTLTRL